MCFDCYKSVQLITQKKPHQIHAVKTKGLLAYRYQVLSSIIEVEGLSIV